jgi:simple sugar transport system ATP-binding protein
MYHAYQVAERFVILTHGEKTADVTKGETSVDHLTELVIGGKPAGDLRSGG